MGYKTVATKGPFELQHLVVGTFRYWYVRHVPTDKFAAKFDGAPCAGKVAEVKAKFLAMVADWPGVDDWRPEDATLEEIKRVRRLQTMFERASSTLYRLAP